MRTDATAYLTRPDLVEQAGAHARGWIGWYLHLVRSDYKLWDREGWPVTPSGVRRRAPRRRRRAR